MNTNTLHHDDDTAHHHGLQHDLKTLTRQAATRRNALRWLAVGSMAPMSLLSGNSMADTASDTSTVLNWAQASYPQWFPASSAVAQSNANFIFRFYPTTDNYLGVSLQDSNLYAYGRETGYAFLNLGPLSHWVSMAAGGATSQTCSIIPQETAGPYPGDGTNSNQSGVANALTLSGIVRSDIRPSIGGATGIAAGIPLRIELELVNAASSCASLSSYAIYLWHCTRDGLYSMYSNGVTSENYLRGVQETSASGVATFQSIFPGCYAGRMPHIHFEVYRNLASATRGSNSIRTSQLAFPTAVCQQVYTADGYSASVRNLSQITFATDNVFSDGVSLQTATVTGDNSAGYVAKLRVGVSG